MRIRVAWWLVVLSLAGISAVFAMQYGGFFGMGADNPAPLPPNADEKTEFIYSRLMYSSARRGRGGGFFGGRGGGGRAWATAYPKNDRQFLQGVRRLTRIHARSMEHVVDLDGDDIFNYPFIYAVEVGQWYLSDAQAAKLREYLLRGGFLMTDDFHGTYEWEAFMASMSRVFPDRPVVEIENKDPIFHVLYDLDGRFQVPGIAPLMRGITYEQDGIVARWRGIYDDKGRIMVAICHNMDLGDAWEHADEPDYPERYASLAYRIRNKYIDYSMTH